MGLFVVSIELATWIEFYFIWLLTGENVKAISSIMLLMSP